ncbi:hypothetical protein Aperf_G00000044689 [Anoplocephala perfoliata]
MADPTFVTHDNDEDLNRMEKKVVALVCCDDLKVPISGSRDSYLHFNKRVVILCPPPPPERVSINHSRERHPVIISVDLDESLIYGEMKLRDNAKIVASTIIKPVARSVFKMIMRGGVPSECPVTYGTPVQFLLAKEELSDAPLYLASDTVSAIGATNPKSGHRWVFLHSDSDDYNTMWKVEHIDPRFRMESEGVPVPAKSRLILRHCKTNSALAIEHSKIGGLYGVEYEVSSCDHLDGHRVENDTNQMMICTDLEEWSAEEPTGAAGTFQLDPQLRTKSADEGP